MQIKSFMKMVLIGVSILTMSACTHNKKGTDPNAGSTYDDPYASAQASGVGENNTYGNGNEAGTRTSASKNTYYFDFDRSEVRDSDKPAIYAQADYLLAHPHAKIILEGHTDPRGSREYNVGLGERRANAIAAILRERGVAPGQIRIVSYGAERRAVPGYTESAYQLDRRAVIGRLQG